MTEYELYLAHHGVKGMKWGVRRKRRPTGDVQESRQTRRLKSAVDRQKKVVDSWKDASPIRDKRGNTIYSSKDIKDIYESASKRLNKLEYKLLISQKKDQIQAGESAIGRIYNKLTDAHTTQAKIEVDIERRARVNKAWRD